MVRLALTRLSGWVYLLHLFSSVATMTITAVGVAAPDIGVAAIFQRSLLTDHHSLGSRGGRRGASRGGGERNSRESEGDYGQDEEFARESS